jgi:hypothetical protein
LKPIKLAFFIADVALKLARVMISLETLIKLLDLFMASEFIGRLLTLLPKVKGKIS